MELNRRDVLRAGGVAAALAAIGTAGTASAALAAKPPTWSWSKSFAPGDPEVHLDMLNPAPAGSGDYTLNAQVNSGASMQSFTAYCNPGDGKNAFAVKASDNAPVGGGTVQGFCLPGNWYDPGKPLTELPHLYATWDQVQPGLNAESEAAFDMYFATVGNESFTFELMVWAESYNTPHYTTSGNGITAVAQGVMINGLSWDVWHWPGAGSTYGGWAFDLSSQAQRRGLLRTATRFDLAPFITWMFTSGQMTYANPTMKFCDFGWEIWSTGGRSLQWTCNGFSLSYT